MLKKLLHVGVLAGLLAATASLSAQSEQEYPHCYGFWSNWSIGIKANWDRQLMGEPLQSGAVGEGSSFGGSLFLEKELNHVWAFDLRAGIPGMITDGDATHPFDRYGLVTVGFKFSVNNALMGYDPERRGSFYLFADGGMAFRRAKDKTGNVALVAEGGLGYSYDVSKRSTLFVEASLLDVSDVPNIFKSHFDGLDLTVALGYMFNFGVTAADAELCAQRSLLTQENFDDLNNKIASLEKDVANGKQNERKLESRISDLETQLANAPKGNPEAVKELQAKIDQIKADQLTFYALPFSILYGVDQYTVASSEQQKLKAIAHVMKDNPNTKYMIYGFCDYTGSDAYNMKLSQKRAEEVKRQLVNKYGIAADRLDCQWKGKTMAFGDIKYGVNRRVSIYRVIE
ncbi:MAG: OmpA family protein [Bacteroidales bacterium]|nr:OmpA family protein [Candidatus Colimorpha onthohippi]